MGESEAMPIATALIGAVARSMRYPKKTMTARVRIVAITNRLNNWLSIYAKQRASQGLRWRETERDFQHYGCGWHRPDHVE